MPPIHKGDNPKPASPFRTHCDKWADGCGAHICGRKNTRRVFMRGTIPADVCFVGEAPGESENILRLPFVGPAGKLLDLIAARSIGEHNQHRSADGLDPLTWCFCNLVGCIPREEDGHKAGEPNPDDIEACRPRLEEFISICRPKLIVTVGSLANKAISPGPRVKGGVAYPKGTHVTNIVHPAAILRANAAQRGLAIQRCIVTVSNALEDI